METNYKSSSQKRTIHFGRQCHCKTSSYVNNSLNCQGFFCKLSKIMIPQSHSLIKKELFDYTLRFIYIYNVSLKEQESCGIVRLYNFIVSLYNFIVSNYVEPLKLLVLNIGCFKMVVDKYGKYVRKCIRHLSR
jgi:hypothetical protein